MFTVIETQVFQKQWPNYWSEEERGEFAAYIAEFPNAGDVVPQSGGGKIPGSKLKEVRRVIES